MLKWPKTNKQKIKAILQGLPLIALQGWLACAMLSFLPKSGNSSLPTICTLILKNAALCSARAKKHLVIWLAEVISRYGSYLFIWKLGWGFCRRVNIAGLRLQFLKKARLQVGPWLASRNLDPRRVPTICRTDESGSLCLNCWHKHSGLCWAPAFLLGVWSFGTC